MQLEYFRPVPGCPGLEEAYSIVPEDAVMNPDCPCQTRTCPYHGFCAMCVRHHRDVDELMAQEGRPGHGTVCQRLRKKEGD